MNAEPTPTSDDTTAETPSPPLSAAYPHTPLSWRLAILATIGAIGLAAYFARDVIGLRGQAAAGILFFFGIVAAFSANLRAVNWRTIGWGIALQLLLALAVLKVPFVYHGFEGAGDVVKQFISFSDEGAKFVFGNLYDARPPEAGGTWSVLFGTNYLFQFAFVALPPILFVSAFFTVLYHFGILQWCVRMLAVVMVYLMRHQRRRNAVRVGQRVHGPDRSAADRQAVRAADDQLGAVRADGQRHGPHLGRHDGRVHQLRRRPRGRAHDLRHGLPVQPVPCRSCSCRRSSTPETAGTVHTQKEKSPYVNAIDAAAAGTQDGLRLALNVAAMLIVFIAFVAMFDALLGGIKPGCLALGFSADALAGWPDDLSLRMVFGWLFSPVAFLMGVDTDDMQKVGSLLGSKLAINEHFAYLQMKAWKAIPDFMSRALVSSWPPSP